MLFNFLRKKKSDTAQQSNKIKTSFGSIYDKIKTLCTSNNLTPELKEELRKTLINADTGVSLTTEILDKLETRLKSKKIDAISIKSELSTILEELLINPESVAKHNSSPTSILMIGINGAGKTTTCGKIAYQLSQEGKQVTLAAGDTYRAAAIEQLKAWGEKANCKVISQQIGSDSASVIHDAFISAKNSNSDYIIADTSGRLHTQANLMGELKKIKKVMAKLDPSAPHETWLVLDASLGQNNIQQALSFKQEIGITGIVITKLDGSGKGGSILSISQQLNLPIVYVGVGETAEDLRPFNSSQFIANLME